MCGPLNVTYIEIVHYIHGLLPPVVARPGSRLYGDALLCHMNNVPRLQGVCSGKQVPIHDRHETGMWPSSPSGLHP